jgi:hypothetical protein
MFTGKLQVTGRSQGVAPALFILKALGRQSALFFVKFDDAPGMQAARRLAISEPQH